MNIDIFFIISIAFFIISFILLLIQGIINNKFFKLNDKEIIAERTVFEQFSYEVYSSINTAIPVYYETKSDCNSEDEPFKFILNLDTFYDCRGIYNSDLNPECRNQIVNNLTTCFSSGRTRLDTGNLGELLDYDDRVKYCQYFSNYTQPLTKLFDKSICKYQTKTYSELLADSVPSRDYYGNPVPCKQGYKRCGVLDTKDNILCIPNGESCPMNEISKSSGDNSHKIDTIYFNNVENKNSKVITSIILSENKPLNHEWDLMIKETFDKISDEESAKRRMVSKNDFILLDNEDFNNYNEVSDIKYKINKICENGSVMNCNLYNSNQELSIYTRNYIGFKNVKELNKFKKYFKENDKKFRNNPLYKLSSLGHNPLITIIIPSIFLALTIGYLCIIIINNYCKVFLRNDIKDYLLYVCTALMLVVFIADLIIIIFHHINYPIIHIDMDARMKSVLDRYNKRVIILQLYREISMFCILVSGIFIGIYHYKRPHNNI